MAFVPRNVIIIIPETDTRSNSRSSSTPRIVKRSFSLSLSLSKTLNCKFHLELELGTSTIPVLSFTITYSHARVQKVEERARRREEVLAPRERGRKHWANYGSAKGETKWKRTPRGETSSPQPITNLADDFHADDHISASANLACLSANRLVPFFSRDWSIDFHSVSVAVFSFEREKEKKKKKIIIFQRGCTKIAMVIRKAREKRSYVKR